MIYPQKLQKPLFLALSLSLCYTCITHFKFSPFLAGPLVSEVQAQQLKAQEIQTLKQSPLVAANNRFAFELFNAVAQGKQTNTFISPASASLALLMAYKGADGETRQAMGKVLHTEDIPLNEINHLSHLLIRQLKAPASDIVLQVANSLWANQEYTFKEYFVQNTQKSFEAEIQSIDFQNASELKKVNAWVKQRTRDKIPHLVSEDPKTHKGTIALLLNAIYFKANWTYKFDKNYTQNRPFHLVGGGKKLHPMMKGFGHFKYYNHWDSTDTAFQAIALPYGKDAHLNMYIFVPQADSDLKKLQSKLTHDYFKQIHLRFRNEQGYVILPKFKLEQTQDLKTPLEILGMNVAFNARRANFLKMVEPQKPEENFYLSKVLQKTFIEVNEEGTVAAAATKVEVSTQPSSAPQTLQMLIDRPFFYLIRDEQTGQILFMGSIYDPQI